MWTAAPGKHFFDVSNDLVDCGHMSGLLARSIFPLALMKSDNLGPIRFASFALMTLGRLFQIFGGDRVVHHVSSHLPNLSLYISPVNHVF
jgi:hypothetical protein